MRLLIIAAVLTPVVAIIAVAAVIASFGLSPFELTLLGALSIIIGVVIYRG
jgi:hypothetical protein